MSNCCLGLHTDGCREWWRRAYSQEYQKRTMLEKRVEKAELAGSELRARVEKMRLICEVADKEWIKGNYHYQLRLHAIEALEALAAVQDEK